MADSRPPSKPPTPSRPVSRSHSRRAVSRPRTSRNPSVVSVPYLPIGPTALIDPDGQIGDEAAELLHEFVHPHHQADYTLVEDDEGEEGDGDDGAFEQAILDWRNGLPWWKRPSPWWFISGVPLSSIAMSMTLAPRIQIYTELACDQYKPEYSNGTVGVVANTISVFNRPYELCVADPDVQQAVSRLALTMLTAMGILGCLTTGFWGSISDRYGRTRIMSLAVVGMLITDATFISTAKYSKYLPGGMWFLVIGPLVDGCLGGYSTVMAAVHAYVADTSEPAARARMFSLLLGLIFTGMSLGPTVGSVIINRTQNVLSVFYIATSVHVLYACLIWVVVPESLAPMQMQQARKLYDDAMRAASATKKRALIKRMFSFLEPLALFLPAPVGPEGGKPLKKQRRDWSLFLLALAHGCVLLLIGGITSKLQYMTVMFGWNSEHLGYWTSIVGAARALYLTVVLPIITKLFQPKPPPIQLSTGPEEPLTDAQYARPPSATRTTSPPPRSNTRHHSPTFDLNLARCSIVLEIASYTLMALAHTGVLFTAWSVLGAFGSGFGPSVSSVATALYTRNGGKELGKLFGALSVVQIVCSQVVGPFLYGLMFMRTVKTFPQAVFVLSIGSLTLALVFLMFIRLPKPVSQDAEEPSISEAASEPVRTHPEREDTLVNERTPLIVIQDVDDDEGRGRKADVKPAGSV